MSFQTNTFVTDSITSIREAIPRKKSPSVWKKSKSKPFKEPFVVVCVRKFLMQGGGVSPKSKLFEELFGLSLDFFNRPGVAGAVLQSPP